MSDDPVTACEECGAPVERVFHPVAVHFKGSGFYNTDYKGKEKAGAGVQDGDSGSSSGELASRTRSRTRGRFSQKKPDSSQVRPAILLTEEQGLLGLSLGGCAPYRGTTAQDRSGRALGSLSGAEPVSSSTALTALALRDEEAAARSRPPTAAARWSCRCHRRSRRSRPAASAMPPMSLTNALGAFQPIQRALDEVVGQAQRVGEAALDPVQDQPAGERRGRESSSDGVALFLRSRASARAFWDSKRVLARGQLQAKRLPGTYRRRCRRRPCSWAGRRWDGSRRGCR